MKLIQTLIITFLALGSWLLAGAETNNGFTSIFDGKSLNGWREAPKGKALAWSIKDGVIRGEGKENRQVYLIYSGDESLKDF